jgi:hypothetical protein
MSECLFRGYFKKTFRSLMNRGKCISAVKETKALLYVITIFCFLISTRPALPTYTSRIQQQQQTTNSIRLRNGHALLGIQHRPRGSWAIATCLIMKLFTLLFGLVPSLLPLAVRAQDFSVPSSWRVRQSTVISTQCVFIFTHGL